MPCAPGDSSRTRCSRARSATSRGMWSNCSTSVRLSERPTGPMVARRWRMADPVDPYTLAVAAAEALAGAVDVPQHDVALVLGSGWGPAADAIGTTVGSVTASDLPGFPPSTVAGHGGAIRSLDADGVRVLAYFGRVHGYEGNPVSAVV